MDDKGLAVVSSCRRLISEGGRRLFTEVPKYIERIIREELWRELHDEEGVFFPSFQAFAESDYPGLYAKMDDLRAWCRQSPEALEALDRVLEPVGDVGRPEKGSDTTKTEGRGRDYLLARLKRDAPALAEAVIRREMSAHAAALEAGIRKPPDPVKEAIKWIRRMTPVQKSELLALIEEATQ